MCVLKPLKPSSELLIKSHCALHKKDVSRKGGTGVGGWASPTLLGLAVKGAWGGPILTLTA